MTSVAGHLVSREFDSRYRAWTSCDPSALFEANIETYVEEDKINTKRNIQLHARSSQILYIWTDCDREGEAIGAEIRDVAVESNPRLRDTNQIFRARFSNIERAHLLEAARNPSFLDEAQADAVAARIELDLRIGASFTRNLTLTIQPMIPQGGDRKVISYGSCQFPTLGFVVERYFQVRNFSPEIFWFIKIRHEKNGVTVKFLWERNHLYDRAAVTTAFEKCVLSGLAEVTKVQTKPTSKWKPLPLTTVELQKCGSSFLRMTSHRVMQVAEALYTKGWISYPRTETDQFDHGMDLLGLVAAQARGQLWGDFAQGLLQGGFSWPRSGRNNDNAHPPIHPVNYTDLMALSPEEQKVYEFVVRRFLACCSTDARGSKTEISILCADEPFNASGLTVLERNYLEVYVFEKWRSTQELPAFTEGETFKPDQALMEEGQSTPPNYLTEPELIAMMDANGIGTDATMAEHINKIQERNYVETRDHTREPRADRETASEDEEIDFFPELGFGRGRGMGRTRFRPSRGGRAIEGRSGHSGVQEFIPTTLGVALIEGYENMGFETSLAKPFLRKEVRQQPFLSDF